MNANYYDHRAVACILTVPLVPYNAINDLVFVQTFTVGSARKGYRLSQFQCTPCSCLLKVQCNLPTVWAEKKWSCNGGGPLIEVEPYGIATFASCLSFE
jgi:hypothetical protein